MANEKRFTSPLMVRMDPELREAVKKDAQEYGRTESQSARFWLSFVLLDDGKVGEEEARIEEVDRSARAYGWEIGKGHPLSERIEQLSPENPFLDKNWRERIQ